MIGAPNKVEKITFLIKSFQIPQIDVIYCCYTNNKFSLLLFFCIFPIPLFFIRKYIILRDMELRKTIV